MGSLGGAVEDLCGTDGNLGRILGSLCWTVESLGGAVEDLCRTVGSLGKTLLILCRIVRILSAAVGIPDGTGGMIARKYQPSSLPHIMIHCNVFILLFCSTTGKVQVLWVQA